MTSPTAIVLFAHGARDSAWADPLRRVQAAIAARAPEQRVALAFLELMTPTLQTCVADLHDAGIDRVTVVPMFIAQGGHLKRDLPEMLAGLRRSYPSMILTLAPAIGEAPEVIEAMANVALMRLEK